MAGTAEDRCLHAWFHQAPMGGPWEQVGVAKLVVLCFPIRAERLHTGAGRAATSVD